MKTWTNCGFIDRPGLGIVSDCGRFCLYHHEGALLLEDERSGETYPFPADFLGVWEAMRQAERIELEESVMSGRAHPVGRLEGGAKARSDLVTPDSPRGETRDSEGRCLAWFQPQAWINDSAVDIDGARHFDITDQIMRMGREAALELRDDRDESDLLAIEAGLLADHSGPFYVLCEQAIREFFRVEG